MDIKEYEIKVYQAALADDLLNNRTANEKFYKGVISGLNLALSLVVQAEVRQKS